MIDIRAARNDPDAYRTALARKGAADEFDELLDADRAVLDVQPRVEELRARRKGSGKPTPEQRAELEQVKAELQGLEDELSAAEARRKDLRIGNGFRKVRKKALHFSGRFQMAFGIAREQPSGSIQIAMVADAGEDIQNFPLMRKCVAHRVGGHDRQR